MNHLHIDPIILYVATSCFVLAVVHTFLTGRFTHMAHTFPDGSIKENLFHLLGEIEVVFGLWAGVFVLFFAVFEGIDPAIEAIEEVNFTEPMFVFAIMTVASTKPVVEWTENVIIRFGRFFLSSIRICRFIFCA
ncbi:MAG: putative Na+/H+ antiporter [Bdellovibrionota bacterium]